jgi:hypothetical protein
MDFLKIKWNFKNQTGAALQGSLARQDMQKTVLKRQGSLSRTRTAEKCLEETGQTCML